MVRALLRSVAKEMALRGLGNGLAIGRKLARIEQARAITVLNLHRVAPHDESAYPPLDPGLFDYLLGFVKARFDVVTFGDLAAGRRSAKPPLVLSFDDGYRDFYTIAAPLLRKHGLRANHNIVPELIETGLPPLNVHIQDFVGRAPIEAVEALSVPGFEIMAPVRSRFALGTQLSEFIKNRPYAEQRALGEALLPQISRVADFRPTEMMSLAELKDVARDHEIGAHSFSHASMAFESPDFFRRDLVDCRDWFERRLGTGLSVYAFPNASRQPDQIDILQAEGVRSVLVVDEDFTYPRDEVFRRFTFAAHSRHEVRFRATGSYRWPSPPGLA